MPETALTHGQLVGLRVLIAEDSWLTADLLSVQLEEEGARVVGPASTCAGALELIGQQVIDVALVDMELGDAFADDLIDDLNRRAIPYVVMTGYGALPTNADEKAVARIDKPIERKLLIRSLRQAMR